MAELVRREEAALQQQRAPLEGLEVLFLWLGDGGSEGAKVLALLRQALQRLLLQRDDGIRVPHRLHQVLRVATPSGLLPLPPESCLTQLPLMFK